MRRHGSGALIRFAGVPHATAYLVYVALSDGTRRAYLTHAPKRRGSSRRSASAARAEARRRRSGRLRASG